MSGPARRRGWIGAALAALLAVAPGSAGACAIELILAVDVSGSIDAGEWVLQSEGMAQGFEDADVIEAIEALPGGLLVTYMQWSGIAQQEQVSGWRLIEDRAGAVAFAAEIRGAERRWSLHSTAIGEALRRARAISREAPVPCARRVIDVSGDGYSNEGPFPGPMADQLAVEGYQVNGLVIEGAEPNPVPHYLLEIIAGHEAFVEVATGFGDFARAFRRKLLRELDTELVIGRAP